MKTYKRELTVANGNSLVVPADSVSACFHIGFPPRGIMHRVVVKQADNGAGAVAFTVNLYDAPPCGQTPPGESTSYPTDDLAPAFSRIVPQLAGTAGNAAEWRPTSNDPMAYENREGTYSDPQRKVYLEIIPDDDSEDTEWEAVLVATPFTAG